MDLDQINQLLKDALARVTKAGKDELNTFASEFAPRLLAMKTGLMVGDPSVQQEDFDVLFANAKLQASELGITGIDATEDVLRGVMSALISMVKIV